MSRLQLNIRARQHDLDQVNELARKLGVTVTQAVRVAVAEKLRRVNSKQKAPAGTEAA